MTTKNNDQQYDDIEYAFFCDSLEEQYEQAKKEGLFEVLKILEIDEEHSDNNLVQAINYFKKKNGLIENDAPINFLTEREKLIVNKEGRFRQGLYCMLLSSKFSEAIENKTVFLQHSLKFAFDKP
ncbi:MAG: hypothetical protein H0U70_00470 [Tatlockia sp.]|nr:hypothetical protein [Tatlockia sp.]